MMTSREDLIDYLKKNESLNIHYEDVYTRTLYNKVIYRDYSTIDGSRYIYLVEACRGKWVDLNKFIGIHQREIFDSISLCEGLKEL